MSIERVEALLGESPSSLRDPVIGYAESVKAALPDIFRQAGLASDSLLENEVVFIAGIRKLYAMVSSTFWTLQKALTKLSEREVPNIRIGGHRYSFDSAEYRRLHALHDSLRAVLEQENLLRFMGRVNYADVVRALKDEHRESQ